MELGEEGKERKEEEGKEEWEGLNQKEKEVLKERKRMLELFVGYGMSHLGQ